MGLLQKIAGKIPGNPWKAVQKKEPERGYDLWSGTYDLQPDNLMLALDEAMFKGLAAQVNFKDKTIADIGCGTGRHWHYILDAQPARLIGYDVSVGMLNVLKAKFPGAETYQYTDGESLVDILSHECDMVISTLALAHIRHPETAIAEWDRILKPGGTILLTDYHPAALALGGDRTFRHGNTTIAIKNYVHPVEHIETIFKKYHYSLIDFDEKLIDERVKHYYEKQNALHVFEQFRNVQIIYGMYLKKPQ